MASQDGEEGIKLEDFKQMWCEDGTKLVEQDRRVVDGHTWLLYAIYFPESTSDYGRHSALLLKMVTETEVIILHDQMNITNEVTGNYRQGIDEWFKRHVGQY